MVEKLLAIEETLRAAGYFTRTSKQPMQVIVYPPLKGQLIAHLIEKAAGRKVNVAKAHDCDAMLVTLPEIAAEQAWLDFMATN